ncbi:MAG TPA: hypothetical protein VHH34_25710, partial [Pseudonocardiaceae bacterium]|nr:hypothetical protein [Pseudonocardiaceae bacterium]
MYLPLVPGPALVALSLTTVAFSVSAQPEVQQWCTPPEAALTELSGLAAGAERWFAVADGGTELRVFVLDPADCAV